MATAYTRNHRAATDVHYEHGYTISAANSNQDVDGQPGKAFIPDRDGTVIALTERGDKITIPVKGGTMYTIAIRMVYSSGTTSSMTVLVLW